MVASRKPAWHRQFLAMLPMIVRHANLSFRHLDPEGREDAVTEVVANAFCAFARLVELGKADIAYASPLARYGVAQVRDGRRIGSKLNVRDVTSTYCQRLKGVVVERLDHFDPEENAWQEIVVEDRHAGPAAIVATRLDFDAWLQSLPKRLRKIAAVLATGETTSATARRFRVSDGRISQMRKELCNSWRWFTGEAPGRDGATLVPA